MARSTRRATASGSPAKGGRFRPTVMPVFTKPGFTQIGPQSHAAEAMVQPFQVAGQTGLGRAVKHHWFSSPLARHGTEDAQRAARKGDRHRLCRDQRFASVPAFGPLRGKRSLSPLSHGQQSSPGLFAEQHRIREVGRQQPRGQRRVVFQFFLSVKQSGRDHHRIEAAQFPPGLVQRRGESSRDSADRNLRASPARRAADLQIAGRTVQLLGDVFQQKQPLAALGQQPGQAHGPYLW